MRLTLQRVVEFEPCTAANLALPEGERVTMTLRVPSAGRFSEVVNRPQGTPMPSRELFEHHCERIDNLTVIDDGEPREITTGKAFVALPGVGGMLEQAVIRLIALSAAPDPTT